MARGNKIVVSSYPKGRKVEGIIGASLTPKPGTIMQIDYSIALVGGRHTWKIYDADLDGGRPKSPIIVLTEDFYQGRLASTAYAAADRAFGFIPLAGDELNCLLLDVAGTADDHTKGEVLIPKDAVGKLIATTGSPEIEPFVLNETITDPVADTLAWVTYMGY